MVGHRSTPVELSELLGIRKRAFGREYCLAANFDAQACSGAIVAAHSIQRNGQGLKRIAKQGHVLTLELSDGYEAKVKRVGLKRASTFTGFCATHDAALFQPIETAPFAVTPERLFLLAYRPLAMEVFLKRAQRQQIEESLSKVRGTLAEDWLEPQLRGIMMGLRDLEAYKTRADHHIARADYGSLEHVVVHFDDTPQLLCSTWTSIEYGFQGQRVQDLQNSSAPVVGTAFTCLPTQTGGVAILSWFDDCVVSRRIRRSFSKLDTTSIPDALLRLGFEYAESCFWNIDWWETLPMLSQEKIMRRFGRGTTSAPRTPLGLVDDGVRAATWSVRKVDTLTSR